MMKFLIRVRQATVELLMTTGVHDSVSMSYTGTYGNHDAIQISSDLGIGDPWGDEPIGNIIIDADSVDCGPQHPSRWLQEIRPHQGHGAVRSPSEPMPDRASWKPDHQKLV